MWGYFKKTGSRGGVAVDAYCARFPVTEQFAKTMMRDSCYWVREAVIAGLVFGKWTRWKARLIQKLIEKGDDLWVLRQGIVIAYLREPSLLEFWHGDYSDPDPTLIEIAGGLVDFFKGINGEPEDRVLGATVRGYEYAFAVGALKACSWEGEEVPERVQRFLDRIEAKFEEIRAEKASSNVL